MRFPTQQEVGEDLLVRDLLFVFNGIETQLISYHMLEDAFLLNKDLPVSPSQRKIVNELCELGWLFKKVYEWFRRNIETSAYCN